MAEQSDETAPTTPVVSQGYTLRDLIHDIADEVRAVQKTHRFKTNEAMQVVGLAIQHHGNRRPTAPVPLNRAQRRHPGGMN